MIPHRVRPATLVPLDFDQIRIDLSVPGPFPVDVLAAASEAAASRPAPPVDATDLELVTVDPPGALDLDQAVAIERAGAGWRVRYAIADVGAWIVPDGPVDLAALDRTQTHYAPDRRTPLHPEVLSEAAASLLPDGPRPAVLWTIDVDADGTTAAVDVRRALVRSRAQLTYEQVQADLDAGHPHPAVAELAHLGEALLADARRRGAIELGLPEQVVAQAADGTWTVTLRRDLPVERWNAQVSLLTGRAAAALMLDGGIGLLRTLPDAPPDAIPRLRGTARHLGIDWPEGRHPGELLAGLDLSRPRHAAFAEEAAELLRGAGYRAFQGAAPDDAGHAGIGGPYAHVTAPLRRLVDRYATEICLALAAGDPVPEWVLARLDALPEAMRAGDGRAKAFDRAIVDATEAFVLQHRVGDRFRATVADAGDRYGTVVIEDPAIRARCDGPDLPVGEAVDVRCTVADVTERRVRFEAIG